MTWTNNSRHKNILCFIIYHSRDFEQYKQDRINNKGIIYNGNKNPHSKSYYFPKSMTFCLFNFRCTRIKLSFVVLLVYVLFSPFLFSQLPFESFSNNLHLFSLQEVSGKEGKTDQLLLLLDVFKLLVKETYLFSKIVVLVTMEFIYQPHGPLSTTWMNSNLNI